MVSLTDGFMNNNGGTGTIDAQGAVSIASTFDGGTANMSFSGSSNQTFTNNGGVNPSGTWTIDKASGSVTLLSDLILSSSGTALTLTNGRFITGANVLALSSGSATVTRTNGYVEGNFRKNYSAVASKSFEVGTANGFSPVTVSVTAGTFPADFIVKGGSGTATEYRDAC